jgi:hypothetical protein
MRPKFLQIAVSLLIVPMLIGTSHAYEEDVHFILTIFLAKQAGITEEVAYELAKYDQGTDDDPATEPFFGGGFFSLGFTAREMFHFATASRINDMFLAARRCNVKEAGQYLHTAGDHYSHAGYASVFGHLTGGHRPDIPRYAPDFATNMAQSLFIQLYFLAEENCRTWQLRKVDFDGRALQDMKRDRLMPFFTHPDDGLTENKLMSLTGTEWQAYKKLWEDYSGWKQSTFGK